ncbi:MAG: lipoprotein signal peptidase [Wenzhouxiangella sp.]|nr:lipoprotein signal peptidase [Wenzhouxiangella sp.]MCH8478912.1 signal peptidase II [Wenzhouxiangella sp.]TVR92804.1 MAG: lipoprotein signal peptidase [Wenzhouxiangellaceae bacterium]
MLPMRPGKYLMWLALAAVLIVLDLWTKHLASTHLALYRPVEITSWLNMTLAHNEGAAFSFLADAGGWQRWFFTIVAGVISLVLMIWLWRLPNRSRLLPTAIALVLGGAIGNMIDRVRFGYVVDFIDVHWRGYHWPAFNVADSVIVIGVALLLIEGFLPRRGPEPPRL